MQSSAQYFREQNFEAVVMATGQGSFDFGGESLWSPRLEDALARVAGLQPGAYSRTRNYLDGAVTRLSPYLSRGVLSTRLVAESLIERGFSWGDCESLIKELAWRDYFQLVWKHQGDGISQDLRNPQMGVRHYSVPAALVNARTGITAVDTAIRDLYRTGYMHNHVRMYTAALACNVGGAHWLQAARWMYYHLLDGDWASNALSWQWVAGAFSTRKYFANQENINKYCYTNQRGTFLDVGYDALERMKVPEVLMETVLPELRCEIPEGPWTEVAKLREILDEHPSKPVLMYHFYQLDPQWSPAGSDIDSIRVMLWEPEFLVKYPASERVMAWVKALAEQIPGIIWISASFDYVFEANDTPRIHFKEHPTTTHYRGHCHPREWLFPEVDGYYPSFSSYWKRCEAKARAMFA